MGISLGRHPPGMSYFEHFPSLLGAKKHTRWEPPSQTADNQLIFHSFFLSIISGMPVAQCGRNWH